MLNKQPPSGSHATPSRTPSWFYKQMDFLDKHIKQRQYSMMLKFCLKNLIIDINITIIFIRRQSNCGDTSDVSTAECASVVRKEMPHEVIEDIETAPEGFQPDEIETFCISEEYAQNSAAPDDEDDDWMNDMSTINSTTGDTNSTASASNVADFDRDVFKTPSPACNKNSTSSGNGVTHGFSEIASPSGEKPFRKKRKLEDGDAALQQSMVNTLDALSSSLRNKTKSVQEDERSKTRNNDPVYDELLQYCSNFARRLADIPNEKSRERIRHAMEMAMFEHKFK
ncbi:uncharacterized protein LOC130688539 [Daphnia carinata]|uniref:uncharacterized protein LOC130688539 n=1 Tax=Daphnia carinata TaxID=120202 RepID=UPI0028690C3A|nr:uncharacterized protein LOC130688539 [Daphnia carinata]